MTRRLLAAAGIAAAIMVGTGYWTRTLPAALDFVGAVLSAGTPAGPSAGGAEVVEGLGRAPVQRNR